MKKEKVNKETGEITEAVLGEVIVVKTKRPNGTVRIQQNFENCPSMAEQHTAHLTDINYLMKRHQPDELAAYISARNSGRMPLPDHDYSNEPSLQDARNVTYLAKKNFLELPEDVRVHFKTPTEFFKFIDNPANQEKMIKLGLLKPNQIKGFLDPEMTTQKPTTTTTTQEAKEDKAQA